MELNGLKYNELRELMVKLGEKSYRADQIFRYFHQQNGKDINYLELLPKKLRQSLLSEGNISDMKVFKRFESQKDSTIKYLLLLDDGNIIESVLMKYSHGYSICISTQVGCRMGCSFCASTKGGLIRNLSVAELANQVYTIEADQRIRISNIVLMGSGEPLDNFCNVVDFFDIINHEKGRNISIRNITLSTCGVVPGIYSLAELDLPITLSISLHSPFDEKRSEIMPIAKRYKLKELFEALEFYSKKTGRRITFEYTLIDKENDSEEDIAELARLMKGMLAHVNLIPLNPIKEFDRGRPEREGVITFQKRLLSKGIPTTIRREMGGDISASCGQLRISVIDKMI